MIVESATRGTSREARYSTRLDTMCAFRIPEAVDLMNLNRAPSTR